MLLEEVESLSVKTKFLFDAMQKMNLTPQILDEIETYWNQINHILFNELNIHSDTVDLIFKKILKPLITPQINYKKPEVPPIPALEPEDLSATLQLMHQYLIKFFSKKDKTNFPNIYVNQSTKTIFLYLNMNVDFEISVTQPYLSHKQAWDGDDYDADDECDDSLENRVEIIKKNIFKEMHVSDLLLVSFMVAHHMLDDTPVHLKDFAIIRTLHILRETNQDIKKAIQELNYLRILFIETIEYQLNLIHENPINYIHPTDMIILNKPTSIPIKEIKEESPPSTTDDSSKTSSSDFTPLSISPDNTSKVLFASTKVTSFSPNFFKIKKGPLPEPVKSSDSPNLCMLL